MLFSNKSNAQSFNITLYDGEQLTGSGVGSLGAYMPISGIPIGIAYNYLGLNTVAHLKDLLLHPGSDYTSQNDRAKSAKVFCDRPMTFIVYDSANGCTCDDYCTIQAKTALSGFPVYSFSGNYEDANIKITYVNHNNSIQGKISSVLVQL